jgi:hypothetical protein
VAGPSAGSWTDEPGARSGVTEAVTDPVGEDWSEDAGPDRGQPWTDEPREATTGGTGDAGTTSAGTTGTAPSPGGDDIGFRDHVPARSEPSNLDTADAPGTLDGVGNALDPLDPRTGTADDPNNPQQPIV